MYTYFIIVNLITYLLFGIDKYKAIHHHYRISETTLLLFCFIGGSLGGFAGMFSFHHKIRKIIFQILVPLFLIIQLLVLYKFH